MTQIDLTKYSEFVTGVTSEESKDLDAMLTSLNGLDRMGNVPRLLTGSFGTGYKPVQV